MAREDILGVIQADVFPYQCPSPLARKLYFYVLSASEFFCRPPYYTRRDHYNSFLLLEVLEGEFSYFAQGQVYSAYQGDFVFINCYQPHEYFTKSQTRFRYIHFDGSNSEQFWEIITQNHGQTIKGEGGREPTLIMQELMTLLIDNPPQRESAISCLLQRLLCALLHCQKALNPGLLSPSILQALDFMAKNFSHPLPLVEIAAEANLSLYHFCRRFKKEVQSTPHEYLLRLRLTKAKELLKTDQTPINEIGYLVGFQSESYFISCFKKSLGMTPGQFRRFLF